MPECCNWTDTVKIGSSSNLSFLWNFDQSDEIYMHFAGSVKLTSCHAEQNILVTQYANMGKCFDRFRRHSGTKISWPIASQIVYYLFCATVCRPASAKPSRVVRRIPRTQSWRRALFHSLFDLLQRRLQIHIGEFGHESIAIASDCDFAIALFFFGLHLIRFWYDFV